MPQLFTSNRWYASTDEELLHLLYEYVTFFITVLL